MAITCLLGVVLLATTSLAADLPPVSGFEGDILLDPETRAFVTGKATKNNAFKATTGRIWDNGRVPYQFDAGFNQARRQVINEAIAEYHRQTCVRFVPRTNEVDHVYMVNQPGCWSIIGKAGGRQLLKLGDWCIQKGTAIHELMHAIGFFHEQSRNDRDNHVVIYWSNIQDGQSYNFQKYQTNYLNEAYDLNSIMHYRNNEFSGNGRWTIASIKNPNLSLGNTQFSASDVRAINRLYRCGGSAPGERIDCVNNHANCDYWASTGECDKNPSYMKLNCKNACKSC